MNHTTRPIPKDPVSEQPNKASSEIESSYDILHIQTKQNNLPIQPILGLGSRSFISAVLKQGSKYGTTKSCIAETKQFQSYKLAETESKYASI